MSGNAAKNRGLHNALLRPFEPNAPASQMPQSYFNASLAEPGQTRAVALARAYLERARAFGDTRGADRRAAELVLERALRGDLARPPLHTIEGSRYQRERDLQYNIRVTRAWLYGAALMGDHKADTAHYDPEEEAARERERTELVKGAHVRGPEGEYDLYTTRGLPLLPITAERDRSAAASDLDRWQRELDALLAQKIAEEEAQQSGVRQPARRSGTGARSSVRVRPNESGRTSPMRRAGRIGH